MLAHEIKFKSSTNVTLPWAAIFSVWLSKGRAISGSSTTMPPERHKIDEMAFDEMAVNEIDVDEMDVDERDVNEMNVNEMDVDETYVDEMDVD